MSQITIRLKEKARSYRIVVKKGIFSELPERILSLKKNPTGTLIVTDKNLYRLYGKKLRKILRRKMNNVDFFVFPPGERTKSLVSLQKLFRFLVKKKFDRKSILIAFGGGVIGDITGFAAASFMRGIGHIQVPTSLMSQVDSSVGGKTGVNMAEGKNLIGAFYQPEAVFVDPDLLKTLPEKEFRSALSEVVKYGIIMDRSFFALLEKKASLIIRRDASFMEKIIGRCLGFKSRIVMKDEKESGIRAVLNLGHTFAHAFETLSEYKKLSHGQAVGRGIVIASRIAFSKGWMRADDVKRIEKLFQAFGLSLSCRPKNFSQFIRVMGADKKSLMKKNCFVLPKAIGRVTLTDDVSVSEIRKAFFG
ncbi:MAG: 3-dehydroquinate synthase [Candidatus Aureabacteria bacterium]|nr:3-dehydroquinate synthase [Candidatus Auribacterota bacterium]